MSETKFVKTKKERNYTVLDNTFIQDASLSWKAKGLMTYLLSLPDDWEIHLSEIEKHSTDGKAALRSAINELKEHGYLMAEQKRKDNRFAEMIYVIIENPAENEKSLFTDFQKTEKQKTEKLNSENRTLQNTNTNKVLKKQNTDDIYSAKPKPNQETTIKHTSHSTKKGDSIVTKSDNGTSQKVTIEPTKKGDCLNTDINTDIKQTDINIMAKKPKEQYDTIYNHYLDNYKRLYEQGKLETDKVKINYGKNGKLIQDLLKIFSVDDILKVLDRGMADWFCLNNGYTLSPILSDSVFSRLLNARPVKEKPQRSDWSGQATDEEYRAGASNLDTIGF
jgi:hypothetical protein